MEELTMRLADFFDFKGIFTAFVRAVDNCFSTIGDHYFLHHPPLPGNPDTAFRPRDKYFSRRISHNRTLQVSAYSTLIRKAKVNFFIDTCITQLRFGLDLLG